MTNEAHEHHTGGVKYLLSASFKKLNLKKIGESKGSTMFNPIQFGGKIETL